MEEEENPSPERESRSVPAFRIDGVTPLSTGTAFCNAIFVEALAFAVEYVTTTESVGTAEGAVYSPSLVIVPPDLPPDSVQLPPEMLLAPKNAPNCTVCPALTAGVLGATDKVAG